jgi:flavodoxin
MKTLVVYDSAYGNTQKVAQAIGAVLTGAAVRHVDQVKPEDLSGLDCLIAGSPTQKMDYTDGMRKFLTSIPHNGLRGINIVAFDTRISIDDVQSTISRFAARLFLHRYAAKPIAAALKEKGGREVVAPEGFFVADTEGPLKTGELERAAAWARVIQQTSERMVSQRKM